MLRRHFMTKAAYKPNIIIYYKADQIMPFLGGEEQRKNFDYIKFDIHFGHYNPHPLPSNIIFINESFDNGVGKLELYQKSINADDKYFMNPFSTIVIDFKNANNTSYIFGTNYQNDCIYELRIEGASIINISNMNNLTKVILPENLKYFAGSDNNGGSFNGICVNTALTKLIIPPNIGTYNQWGDEFDNSHRFINKNNESIELIFTSNEVPKFAYHKNDIIKCPPNLVDKYKEYYPNAISANNILYIKKITEYSDENINFGSDRDVDNELYITKNYTDDGYTEINIINYDDFESNISSVSVYLGNTNPSIDYDYITEIILPESITTLTYRFLGSSITKLTIPKNVTEIESTAISNILILEENFINLSNIDIPSGYSYRIVKNGKEENGCVIGDYKISNKIYKNTLIGVRDILYKNIIIPDYVETIRDSAFYGTNIEYVFISKNITSISPDIASNIFSYTNCIIEVSEENKKYDSRNNCNAVIETQTNKLVCGNKLSVIPDSVKIIGFAALEHTDFDILDLKNVESVLTAAFQSSSINKLILNNTITNIENNAFKHIKNVIYKGTIAEWNNIYISSTAFRTGTIIHCVDGDITYN